MRHHYVLDAPGRSRASVVPDGLSVRTAAPADAEALAALMLEAYRGTIDYEGEGIAEARAEVSGFFDGRPIPSASVLLCREDGVVSACLCAEHDGDALVGYVMTMPDSKQRGLGTVSTRLALEALGRLGYDRVHAWITEGNTPSERIFEKLGFEIVT